LHLIFAPIFSLHVIWAIRRRRPRPQDLEFPGKDFDQLVDFAGINPVGTDLGYDFDDLLPVRAEIAACLIFDVVYEVRQL
jgi:hypothetical protein